LCIRFHRLGRTRLVNRVVITSDRRVAAWGALRANWIYLKVGASWGLGFRNEETGIISLYVTTSRPGGPVGSAPGAVHIWVSTLGDDGSFGAIWVSTLGVTEPTCEGKARNRCHQCPYVTIAALN
jgi:hypothetical protein